MSDLFVAELLILVLLLPPLLRPFLPPLQRLSGIAALPLAALLLAAATLLGNRFRLSFAPVLLFTVLVFLFTLPRLYRLATGLPSDWFSAGVKVFYVLFLVLGGGTAWLMVRFAPELAWAPVSVLAETRSSVELGGGRIAWLHSLEPADRGTTGTVLFIGTATVGDRSTAAQVLAEAGYRVTEAVFSGRTGLRGVSIPFAPGQIKDLIARIRAARSERAASGSADSSGGREREYTGVAVTAGTSGSVSAAALSSDILALVRKIREESGGSMPIFILTEGFGVPVVLEALEEDSALFTGTVCLLPAGSSVSVEGAASLRGSSGFMSADSATAPVLLFFGEVADLFGFGEVGADDPLAAFLAGGERDPDRKVAELTARRLIAWFNSRH